jgi:hypothetical protein
LLFVGTEFSVFLTLNGGESWSRLRNGLPTVAVQDMVIHPRDNDLVAGTHGRAIWILDDITPLQQLTPAVMAADAHLFQQRPATLWENTSRGGQRGHFWFAGENPPTIGPTSSLPRAEFRNVAMVSYYLGQSPTTAPTLEISDLSGAHVFTTTLDAGPGIHRYRWDLQFDAKPLTEQQTARVNEVFDDLLEAAPFSADQLQAARSRFEQARTPTEQRRALSLLLNPIFESGLSPHEYGIPSAGPGTYKLEMTVDGVSYTGTLSIRADPILSGAP